MTEKEREFLKQYDEQRLHYFRQLEKFAQIQAKQNCK